MISVEGVKVEFGVRPLFSDVTFVVNDRDRIALVGKNGAGKTTMLRLLCGEQQPTTGVVAVSGGTTIGYLPQVMTVSDQTSVRNEARKAFADITALRQRVESMNAQLAERTDYESESYLQLVERFTREHDRLLMSSADNVEGEIERTLTGLGFDRSDLDRPTSEFSGGWRMRIELAKVLLRRPDVLLLDEPTNHLDIESIQWLETFIRQSAKALVLVSHDRAFINNVTHRTLEISCGKVIDYKVGYDDYVKLRAERREQQLRAYDNQQKEIQDIKLFIERFRYQATKAIQVQSRIKQLQRMVPIEVDDVDQSALRLKFPPCLRSGDYPVTCDEVSKAYGAHTVFSRVNLAIRRGEKVAFVGRNGEGKTTLVKCIMGEIAYGGTLKIGHNVQIGYFAQNQAQMLDGELTVYDTIDRAARGDIRLKIRDILGAFMFGGEASDKKVKVLSGGERSRLAMIRLLLQPVNLLILDEPTNHLDMTSKDVLKEAIRAFDGTAIIVSHDRQFLDGLADKVYEFAHGTVREHIGGIYDYLRHEQQAHHEQPSRPEQPSGAKPTPPATVAPADHPGRQDYAQRKERQRRTARLDKQIKDAERRIADMERRLHELDTILCTPEGASDMTIVTEYTSTKRAIDELTDRWAQLSTELESLTQ